MLVGFHVFKRLADAGERTNLVDRWSQLDCVIALSYFGYSLPHLLDGGILDHLFPFFGFG